ncbi:hypothetical protein BDBG_16971 [Blastomyces gilchristii SLH14081]|uniref:Protein kinase domain-containing protein n=1 Tax=Blastomyces gilchristii (strain SLH14081) TaxID=559298 RepID=A0A179UJJ0_BLAGS|nr:uncharacterized protein BDBG_16971 [Blastomyces gilchristii SLH14081]EQL30145.1 hypothetical protein BDFG_07327 [Blastomyces dermatitidis ATCC 26199]OAT08154.1 hypothetical protein BDBG_16971 [Blastomyces gilchristii SLH14081]
MSTALADSREYVSQSGQSYRIEQVLQEETSPSQKICLALDDGVDPLAIVIERQISYFADEDALNGFLRYLGDNPWVWDFEVIQDGFNKDNLHRSFFLWKSVDDDFKSAMKNFDLEKRITAREALAHKWFEGV